MPSKTPAGTDMVALSNMPARNKLGGSSDAIHIYEFEPTPVMSPYLLAVAAGDLVQYKQAGGGNATGAAAGLPELRFWAAPGLEGQLAEAAQVVPLAFQFYSAYFENVSQPAELTKYDLVAVPGRQGAMEVRAGWGWGEERAALGMRCCGGACGGGSAAGAAAWCASAAAAGWAAAGPGGKRRGLSHPVPAAVQNWGLMLFDENRFLYDKVGGWVYCRCTAMYCLYCCCAGPTSSCWQAAYGLEGHRQRRLGMATMCRGLLLPACLPACLSLQDWEGAYGRKLLVLVVCHEVAHQW